MRAHRHDMGDAVPGIDDDAGEEDDARSSPPQSNDQVQQMLEERSCELQASLRASLAKVAEQDEANEWVERFDERALAARYEALQRNTELVGAHRARSRADAIASFHASWDEFVASTALPCDPSTAKVKYKSCLEGAVGTMCKALESTATPSEVLSERLHVQESARSAFATFLEANDEEANSRLDAHVSSELASLREWTLKMVREVYWY